MQILLANVAIAVHRSLDLSPNAVHMRLQQRASIPDGPAEREGSSSDCFSCDTVEHNRVEIALFGGGGGKTGGFPLARLPVLVDQTLSCRLRT